MSWKLVPDGLEWDGRPHPHHEELPEAIRRLKEVATRTDSLNLAMTPGTNRIRISEVEICRLSKWAHWARLTAPTVRAARYVCELLFGVVPQRFVVGDPDRWAEGGEAGYNNWRQEVVNLSQPNSGDPPQSGGTPAKDPLPLASPTSAADPASGPVKRPQQPTHEKRRGGDRTASSTSIQPPSTEPKPAPPPREPDPETSNNPTSTAIALINVETQDLTDDEIDQALRANRLQFGNVPTDTREAVVRQRKGQDRIHKLTVENYEGRCAVCDVMDPPLLIASHIVAWAKAPEHRGNLSNVICLCRIHDALFEAGYWSLGDSLELLKRKIVPSETIRQLLDAMTSFRPPLEHPPAPRFVQHHRERSGFGSERQ